MYKHITLPGHCGEILPLKALCLIWFGNPTNKLRITMTQKTVVERRLAGASASIPFRKLLCEFSDGSFKICN
jgi:hypothetical protein